MSGPLTPSDIEAKTGEAFTPEQMDEIAAGEYPTPKQLTPDDKETKAELQEEQEKRIEASNQGDRE